MEVFWKTIHRRAWAATAKTVGLDGARVWVLIAGQLIAAAAIYLVLGSTEVTALPRILAAAVPFLTFPVWYLVNFIRTIPVLASEDQAKIKELQRQLVAKPKPPSQEAWITPPEACLIVSLDRGFNDKTDPEGEARWNIFTEFRQLAADGELLIRGRPQNAGRFDFLPPLENIPAEHWRTSDFRVGAYLNDDPDRNDEIGTADDLSLPAIMPPAGRTSYNDLYFRKKDILENCLRSKKQ